MGAGVGETEGGVDDTINSETMPGLRVETNGIILGVIPSEYKIPCEDVTCRVFCATTEIGCKNPRENTKNDTTILKLALRFRRIDLNNF